MVAQKSTGKALHWAGSFFFILFCFFFFFEEIKKKNHFQRMERSSQLIIFSNLLQLPGDSVASLIVLWKIHGQDFLWQISKVDGQILL